MRRPAQRGRSPGNSCEKSDYKWQWYHSKVELEPRTHYKTPYMYKQTMSFNNSLCFCFPLGLMLLAFLCSPGSVLLLNKLIVLKGDQGTMTTFSSACLSRASPFLEKTKEHKETGQHGSIHSPGQIPGARPTPKRLILTWHLVSLFFATHEVREWPWREQFPFQLMCSHAGCPADRRAQGWSLNGITTSFY